MRLTYKASALGLTLLGLAVAIYMTIFKLTSNPAMCLGNGGCTTVNNSPYASVQGIPIAYIGVAGYLLILGLLLLPAPWSIVADYRTLALFGVTLSGFIFTVYLIYLEVWKIKALCPFCLASQAIMTILFILTTAKLARE